MLDLRESLAVESSSPSADAASSRSTSTSGVFAVGTSAMKDRIAEEQCTDFETPFERGAASRSAFMKGAGRAAKWRKPRRSWANQEERYCPVVRA